MMQHKARKFYISFYVGADKHKRFIYLMFLYFFDKKTVEIRKILMYTAIN